MISTVVGLCPCEGKSFVRVYCRPDTAPSGLIGSCFLSALCFRPEGLSLGDKVHVFYKNGRYTARKVK